MKRLIPCLHGFACTLILAVFGSLPAYGAFYPDFGSLSYNGGLYLSSYMVWSSPGPWADPEPGYEHDLWVHSYDYFLTIPPVSCTTVTNLPDGYNDCPTGGIQDPNGPVFSFGSFDAELIAGNTYYFGSWTFLAHGSLPYVPFTLQGQQNHSICTCGLESIACMASIPPTQNLLNGWYMVWGGYPSTIFWP